MTLRDELAEVEAKAALLRRRIAAATCAEAGCNMQFTGGRHCGCSPDACCSLPIYTCARCGDSDYGDSDESKLIVERCEHAEYFREQSEPPQTREDPST